MTREFLWRGVFIVGFCVILAIPAQAQQNSLNNIARNIVLASVAVAAALVVITVVVVHESRKKRTVTGCIASGENGMSVTDEKDKKIYSLSGNTASIKPNDRVTLQGKEVKPKDAKPPFVWQVSNETKDFGACQL